MSFELPLSQDDKNFLVEVKENAQDLNEQIEESSITVSSEIAKLLLTDVPFKKQLDPIHFDIFEFEEELRYLNGTTVLQPLQERGFTISSSSSNPSRLYLNDGRLIVNENEEEILNLPLFPVRGFSRSQVAGTNFDIWSRDRFGSTTSTRLTSNIFTIDDAHTNLRVIFDDLIDVEIDISQIISIIQEDETLITVATGEETEEFASIIPITSDTEQLRLISGEIETILTKHDDYEINYTTGKIDLLVSLPVDSELLISYHNIVQIEAAAIASTIQLLLQQSDSALENVTCVFNPSIQTFTIISSHAGSTAKVEVIDSSENDIRYMLGFTSQFMIQGKYQNNLLNVEIDGETAEIKIADFRLCFEDSVRGFNNDDIGFDWSGSLSLILGYDGYNRLGPMFCSGINNGKDVARSIEAQLRMVGRGGFKDATVNYFTDSQTFVIYSGTMGIESSVHVLPTIDQNRDARSFLGYTIPQEEREHEESFDTLQKMYEKINSSVNLPLVASNMSSPETLSHSILYIKPEGVNITSDFQDFDMTTTKIYDNGSKGLPRLYHNGKLVIDSVNDKIDFFEILNVEKTAYLPWGVYNSESEVAESVAVALNLASGSSNYSCVYTQQKTFKISKNSGTFALLWQTGTHATTNISSNIGFPSSDTSMVGSHTSNIITFQMQDYFYPEFCSQFDGEPKVPDYSIDEQSALLKEQKYLDDEVILNNFLDSLQTDFSLGIFDNEVMLDSWEQLANLEFDKVNQEFNAIRYHRGAYANHISETDQNVVQKTYAYNNLIPNRNNLAGNLAHHAAILNITPNTKIFDAGADFSNGGSNVLTVALQNGIKFYNKPAPDVRYSSSPIQIPGYFSPSGLMSDIVVSFVPESIPAFTISADPGTKGFSYSSPNSNGYNVLFDADTTATMLSSNSGPYDMSAGDTLSMIVDGGSIQTATFNALPGYTESRNSISSIFVIKINVNDKIDFKEDLLVELTCVISPGVYTGPELAIQIQTKLNSIGTSVYDVSYTLNKFIISSNGSGGSGIFSLLWNSGTNATTSIRYVLGYDSVDSIGNPFYLSDNEVFFVVQANVNDQFSIRIDGVSSSSVLFISQGQYNSSTLINEITTQIANNSAFNITDFTVTYPGDKIRITSTTLGDSSTVEVYEGVANDFLRTVELDGDVPVHGGSDVINIDAVTVDEVCTVLNAEILGISATNSDNKVKITTSSSRGSVSSIQITGGTCRTILGFNLSTVVGDDVDNKLRVIIDNDYSKDVIKVITSESSMSGYDMALDIFPKLISIGFLGVACDFNKTTVFQTFTNSLRIISGTYGVTSSVYISDQTIKITSGINDSFLFEEFSGVQLNAYITEGFYNPNELSQEIKTQLDSVGSNIYTVSYSYTSKKMNISSSGSFFSMLFSNLTTIASDIGFYRTNHIGSLSYEGEGFVKWGSCHEELGFDAQTIEVGHTIDSAKLTISNSQFLVRIYWSDNGGGDRLDLNINLSIAPTNTLKGLIEEILMHENYQTGSKYSPAFLISRIAGPFRIEDNDTLYVLSNDDTSMQTFTFSAERATVYSDVNAVTRMTSGMFSITINGFNTTVNIDEQLTPQGVASRIQQQIRSKTNGNKQIQAALSLFECLYDYDDLKYILVSGTGGTSSSILVGSESTAVSLKINGLSSYIASSDVVNSCFVTCQEIVTKLSTLTGITVSIAHSSYIKLTSEIEENTSRIQIGGNLANKFGFFIDDGEDGPVNNEAFPFVDLDITNSICLKEVFNVEIKSPIVEQVNIGWEESKGNIEFIYYTINTSKIVERQPIISTRQSFISTRNNQIGVRVSEILGLLTPSLYETRKSKVSTRLNKKTGSYVKIGDKFAQQESNQSIIDSNDGFINNINSILDI